MTCGEILGELASFGCFLFEAVAAKTWCEKPPRGGAVNIDIMDEDDDVAWDEEDVEVDEETRVGEDEKQERERERGLEIR